jgi:hypothetical protein
MHASRNQGGRLGPFRILSTTNPFRKIAVTAKIRARAVSSPPVQKSCAEMMSVSVPGSRKIVVGQP